MPTYPYKCPKCGKEEEVTAKIGEDSPPICQECKEVMARVWLPTQHIWHCGQS